jgi:hypothetical protein
VNTEQRVDAESKQESRKDLGKPYDDSISIL